MKAFYFMLCLTLYQPVSAQLPYTPFSFSGSIWRESYYDGSGGQMPLFKEYQHTVSGDTTINAVSYAKLHTYGLISYNSSPPSPSHYFGGYAGAIRETASREIRIILPGDSSETLLYDFNIGPGDTIALYHTEGLVVTVEQVDTVDVCGQLRNRYLLHFSTGLLTPLYLIEGVGSSHGLIPEYEYFESGSRLQCYTNAQCAPCTLVGQSEPKVGSPTPVLAPNPATDALILSSPEQDWLAVYIFDAQGRLAHQVPYPGKQYQLGIGDWPIGMYIFQFHYGHTTRVRRFYKN